MKKIVLLSFIYLSIGLISCKSKDPKELIVNKWKIKDIEIPNMPLPDTTKASLMKGTLQFTQDGKMIRTGMGKNQSGTYTLSDDGKNLFVMVNGKTETNEIKELTTSKLILIDKTNNSKLTVVPR
ncbi:MAG: lipocalin family protein [Chitinophagaceae bacterium]